MQDAELLGSGSLGAGAQQQGGSGRAADAAHQLHYDACMPLPPYALRAGPREQIYFDPATVTAAIVTTGVLTSMEGGGAAVC